MSINVVDGRLTVTLASGFDGYSSAITYAQSLLHVLAVTNREAISQDDLYNVCDLIMEMLPDQEQMYRLYLFEQKQADLNKI